MTRAGTHRYRLLLCVTCGFALPANKWAQHRRMCTRVQTCPVCRGPFPCRKTSKRITCPEYERPREVTKKDAPTHAVVRSLDMQVSRTEGGKWRVAAWWLKDSIYADTWEAAYWAAIKELKSRVD